MIPKMLVLAGDARTNAVGPQKSTISVLNDMLSRFSWHFIGELNPFAPEPPVTARADQGPFYPL